ncbi:GerMN domain-containing protein [Cohnella sp. CFH 77786]|uniref:GerMN domain-containing protein n=1 Tax=Cohnella sp. CFH 77786 TaxID=2662265 RepID=UPI001C608D3C|nr:GerMN domain-containing protein [Cohnella sp. CFH 77786]
MNRKSGRRLQNLKWTTVLLLLPLVSACTSSGSGSGKSAAIDPPPTLLEESMLQEAEPTKDAGASPETWADPSGEPSAEPVSKPVSKPESKPAVGNAAPEDSVTVYLKDEKGYLAPMTLRPAAEDNASESVQAAADTALAWLTKDPKRIDLLPEGFSAVLPEGTQFESVKPDTETGTVSIDFAAPLPSMPADEERKMLEALVWSMTEIPGMDKVKLTAQGKPISLPASGIPADGTLTRGIGINVEQAKGVTLSKSMGVTLYFSSQSSSGEGYFVPVTRLIDRTPDRLEAALNELIKGPLESDDLRPVLSPDVTVDKLTPKADTVNVSLRQEGWSPNDPVPSDMMEALVLTMTEAAGAPMVKVTINGVDKFLDSDQRSYERPVTRPTAVNMLKQ